ncbi:MAG TPA: gliding motility-associated C-terminal domain-containing protein [Bacteroidia bacterium]|nr:gliding motility-associated C-terminal domain-containing protein [Bacteroidia bacterium]
MSHLHFIRLFRKFSFEKGNFFLLLLTLFICCWTTSSKAQCGVTISSFPYHEDFELSAGGWVAGGTNNDWAWGSPSKPLISGAGSGSKCWITGGIVASFYNFSERSYVESPCFNFSTLTNPHITLKIFWDTEYTYDGANLQYSTNSGVNWTNVGAYGDAIDCMNENWYNLSSVNNLSTLATVKNGWCGTIQPSGGSCVGGGGSGAWLVAKHTMPYLAGEASVKFRIIFGAGTTCNSYDGFAFDDITIKNAAAPITVVPALQPSGCTIHDGSAALAVNGGTPVYSYSWNPNVSSTNTATGLSAGNYTVTVTDMAGCSKVSSFAIGNTPAVSLTTVAFPDTCEKHVGAASVIAQGGTPPFTYLWSPQGNTTPAITNSGAGSYMVIVTDSKGCTKSENAEIDSTGAFTIDLGSDTTICGNGFLLMPGNFSQYIWQDQSGDSVFNVQQPGIYSVEVMSASGCTAADTLEVIEDCLHDIVVPNAFSPNEDGLNDVFNAQAVNVKSYAMNIYNRWGGIVFESNSIQNGWNGAFKKSKCVSGIYFWVATYSTDDNEMKEKKGTVFLVR